MDTLLEQLNSNDEFLNALHILSYDFHTYSDEEGVVYEEDMLRPFYWSSGVSKVCIILNEIVLKKAFAGTVTEIDWVTGESLDDPEFDEYEQDMCELEYQVYQKAIEADVAEFFAELVQLDDGIYAQPKCDLTFDKYLESKDDCETVYLFFGEDECDLMKQNFDLQLLHCKLNSTIMSYLYAEYPLKKLQALQDFLRRYDINDLHYGNMGFFNGKLKFFDYCGYCSSTIDQIRKENSEK